MLWIAIQREGKPGKANKMLTRQHIIPVGC